MACVTDDLACLTVHLRFPAEYWRRIPHSNLIERTFGETRRRVKVIGRLPGENSCLSLVWAVLDRASRGWRGLTMSPQPLRLLQDLRRQLLHPATGKEVSKRLAQPPLNITQEPATRAVYTATGTPPRPTNAPHSAADHSSAMKASARVRVGHKHETIGSETEGLPRLGAAARHDDVFREAPATRRQALHLQFAIRHRRRLT